MKWLLNISTLLLILLTLMPMTMGAFSSCGSEDHACDQAASSEEDETDNNCCLSLCFCSCCGTTFYIENKEEFFNQLSFYNLDIHSSFIYQPPFSPTVLLDIWQPPKI